MQALLSIREAAERSGLSRPRIQQMVLRGEIRGAQKIGGVWIIPERSLPQRQRQRNPKPDR